MVQKRGLALPLNQPVRCREALFQEDGASVRNLVRISHYLTAEARNRPAITALRLLAVLNVLFEYASARRAAGVRNCREARSERCRQSECQRDRNALIRPALKAGTAKTGGSNVKTLRERCSAAVARLCYPCWDGQNGNPR